MKLDDFWPEDLNTIVFFPNLYQPEKCVDTGFVLFLCVVRLASVK